MSDRAMIRRRRARYLLAAAGVDVVGAVTGLTVGVGQTTPAAQTIELKVPGLVELSVPIAVDEAGISTEVDLQTAVDSLIPRMRVDAPGLLSITGPDGNGVAVDVALDTDPNLKYHITNPKYR